MKISLVHISNFKLDGGAMFGVIPKVLWEKRYPSDENNLVDFSLRSIIIDNGSNVVLVDTGYGDKQSEKFFSHTHMSGGDGLIGGIKKTGYQPEDITDVFLTHLHADHAGGALKRGSAKDSFELTFPAANIWVSRRQWDWACKSNVREAGAYPKENILPLENSGRLKFVEEEGELFKGFSVKIVNGHTPGQMLPLVDYLDTKFLYTADLMPTVAHIPLLWNMSYDIDQLATIDEKQKILKEVLDNNYFLFFQHDIQTECCTLKDTPKGIREDKLFDFSEFNDY